VVDVTGSSDTATEVGALEALRILEDELEMYSKGLSKKVCAVVANKLDKGPEAFEALNDLIENVGDKLHVYPTVASEGHGVEEVVQFLLKVIRQGDLERRQQEASNKNDLGLNEARDLWLWEERTTGEFDDMRQ